MALPSDPRGPTLAESLFVDWLAHPSQDFAQLLNYHPEHRAELASLHSLWQRLQPLFALAGLSTADAISQLRAATTSSPGQSTSSNSAGGTSTSDLLRRLESKRRPSRYRLEGEVARGGMGAILRVWDEDIRRHLAMKVVLGQATGSGHTPPVDGALLARFLEEAQITGQLEHPGIVPVHELGLDQDGRVYFTMKLVKGRDLAAIYQLVHKGQQGWSQTRALGVLLKACEALAYAHSKGVIHRDLKPQNVMVGDFGEVYVMDWGLARVLSESSEAPAPSTPSVRTERVQERESSPGSSFMTRDGDVVGTPAYMPPEQARGDMHALSPRSDVYSLGAMLYHLLAGYAPYMAPGEASSGNQVWERVLEGPPQSLESLSTRVPSELIAIQEKAMAREPAQRYADVAALAEDLRAFLEGRVVGAFETGAFAEARKWVRRNKSFAAALAGTVLALAAGLVVSLILSDRLQEKSILAENRRVEAVQSAKEALKQARVARAVNEFLNEDVLAAVAPEREGIDVSVREVLDRASLKLEGRFADDPAVEAALRLTMGTSYAKLGLHETARIHLERALQLHSTLSGADSEPALVVSISLAGTWAELGRIQDAIQTLRKAAQGLERFLGPEHTTTLSSRIELAVQLSNDGKYDEALREYDSALAILKRTLPAQHNLVLAARNNRALLQMRRGEYKDAIDELEQVFEIYTQVLGERHPETLTTLGNLASLMFNLGRYADCEQLARRGHAICVEVLGPKHPRTGTLAGFVGHVLLQNGANQEAERWLVEYYETARAAVGEETELAQQARTLMAGSMAALGRYKEAIDLQTQTIANQKRILGADHPTTLTAANSLAMWLFEAKRFDEAEQLFRETMATQIAKLGVDHPSTIITHENLSNLLRARGKLDECSQLLREVLEARKRTLSDDHPDIAKTSYNLGLVLFEMKRTDDALVLLEDAAQRCRNLKENAPLDLLTFIERSLGDAYYAKKDYAQALKGYRAALEGHRPATDGGDSRRAFLMHQIATNLVMTKDYEAAVAMYEQAYPLRLLGTDADGTNPRYTHAGLARALLELGRYAECEPIARDVFERTLRIKGPEHAETKTTRKILVDLYTRWGKPEEAAKVP